MSNGKKTTLLLLLLFCSSLAHAQKQVPIERKDTIANESNITLIPQHYNLTLFISS